MFNKTGYHRDISHLAAFRKLSFHKTRLLCSTENFKSSPKFLNFPFFKKYIFPTKKGFREILFYWNSKSGFSFFEKTFFSKTYFYSFLIESLLFFSVAFYGNFATFDGEKFRRQKVHDYRYFRAIGM